MGKRIEQDRAALIGRLEAIRYEPGKDSEDAMLEEMSMAKSLLKLAEIDHEKEYMLCRSLAEHLLTTVPEPEDMEG